MRTARRLGAVAFVGSLGSAEPCTSPPVLRVQGIVNPRTRMPRTGGGLHAPERYLLQAHTAGQELDDPLHHHCGAQFRTPRPCVRGSLVQGTRSKRAPARRRARVLWGLVSDARDDSGNGLFAHGPWTAARNAEQGIGQRPAGPVDRFGYVVFCLATLPRAVRRACGCRRGLRRPRPLHLCADVEDPLHEASLPPQGRHLGQNVGVRALPLPPPLVPARAAPVALAPRRRGVGVHAARRAEAAAGSAAALR